MSLFTLDGRTLESFGLVPNPGHAHPAAPGTRDKLFEIPGRDGFYDFGATLGERSFSFPLTFPYEVSRYELQTKIREFVSFLYDSRGKPRTMELTFDYDMDKYYSVRVSGTIDPQRIFQIGQFTLSLVAFDPFARSLANSDAIILDSDILLESDIHLDDVWSFTVTSTGSHEVNNFGDLSMNPQIVVDGSFTTLSITANGISFSYAEAISSQQLTVNGERKTVKVGSENKIAMMSGDFIELLPGVNSVMISGTELDCEVSFVFRAKYL